VVGLDGVSRGCCIRAPRASTAASTALRGAGARACGGAVGMRYGGAITFVLLLLIANKKTVISVSFGRDFRVPHAARW
jgi:hypothetical protein